MEVVKISDKNYKLGTRFEESESAKIAKNHVIKRKIGRKNSKNFSRNTSYFFCTFGDVLF